MNSWIPLATIAVGILLVGCGKPPELRAPSVEENVLSIEHMKFGLEKFKVDSASCNLYQAEDGAWEFVIDVNCKQALLRSKKLEEVTHAEPHFEATAVLPKDQLELSVGRVIVQAAGYDYVRDENLSNIYYFSHESIEQLRIELIEVTDEWIDAKVTGETIINGSNGVKPDAKISVLAKFKRDEALKRGIS